MVTKSIDQIAEPGFFAHFQFLIGSYPFEIFELLTIFILPDQQFFPTNSLFEQLDVHRARDLAEQE